MLVVTIDRDGDLRVHEARDDRPRCGARVRMTQPTMTDENNRPCRNCARLVADRRIDLDPESAAYWTREMVR